MSRNLKPTRPMHYPGYIAPNGDYYACPTEAHIALADWIVKELNLSVAKHFNGQRILESRNWLHLDREGNIRNQFTQDTITQSQMNTLGDLLTCEHHTEPPPEIRAWKIGNWLLNGTAEDWKFNIEIAIEYYDGKVKE